MAPEKNTSKHRLSLLLLVIAVIFLFQSAFVSKEEWLKANLLALLGLILIGVSVNFFIDIKTNEE